MSRIATLEDIYLEQLKNLYSAEIQLIEALPEMIRAARALKLKASFQHHLEQTYRHIERIEQILEDLDQSPAGHRCDAMTALVKEIKKSIREDALAAMKDAALIAAARRIKHYKIDGYSCVCAYASLLDYEKAADLLQATLNEETEMDRGLTNIAEKLNVEVEAPSSYR